MLSLQTVCACARNELDDKNFGIRPRLIEREVQTIVRAVIRAAVDVVICLENIISGSKTVIILRKAVPKVNGRLLCSDL